MSGVSAVSNAVSRYPIDRADGYAHMRCAPAGSFFPLLVGLGILAWQVVGPGVDYFRVSCSGCVRER